MASQPSFDITSKVDLQEVDNAINQAKKELAQRFDFKGSKSSIELKAKENLIELIADDNFKMGAVWEVVQTRLDRRGGPTKNLKAGVIEPIGGGLVKRNMSSALVAKLEPRTKAIADIIKKHNLEAVLEVVLRITMDDTKPTPAIGFDKKTLSFVCSVGATIDVDTYRNES